jgi:hypothetical protein
MLHEFSQTQCQLSLPLTDRLTLFVRSYTPIARLIFEALTARLKRATLSVMGAGHARPSLLCG